MYWQVLIYPLGLMRIVQMIIAIIALTCSTEHTGELKFLRNCSSQNETETFQWKYPYDLINTPGPVSCDQSSIREPIFLLSFKIQAQLFVFVGVASVLVTILTLLFYLLRWYSYESDPRFSYVDTILSILLTLLWLASSCSWTSAVSIMKMFLTRENISRNLFSIKQCQQKHIGCQIIEYEESFGNLNFSIVCGFVSVVLWMISSGVTYKRVVRLKSENERYQHGSATVADAFSSSNSPSSTFQ